MKCPQCENEEHPPTAIFCLKCGWLLDPSRYRRAAGPVFPGLFNVRCWLEGKEQRKGFFGAHRRAFAICFTVMPAPKQAIAVDGNLHLTIKGVLNNAGLELDVPVRSQDFTVKRFDLMMVSYQSLSYLYRHPNPAIPVPTDGGCKIRLTLTAGAGEVYEALLDTFFTDREPGTGPPPGGPWTA